RLDGDLTVGADGRLLWMTPDEEVHDLGDAIACGAPAGRDRAAREHAERLPHLALAVAPEGPVPPAARDRRGRGVGLAPGNVDDPDGDAAPAVRVLVGRPQDDGPPVP